MSVLSPADVQRYWKDWRRMPLDEVMRDLFETLRALQERLDVREVEKSSLSDHPEWSNGVVPTPEQMNPFARSDSHDPVKDEIDTLNKDELRDLAKDAGVKTSGKKSDLRARMLEIDRSDLAVLLASRRGS